MKKFISTMLALSLIVALLIPVNASESGYFPQYTGTSGSLVDGLNVVGADSSFSAREKIAAANGVAGYIGTANQNKHLLSLLKEGLLLNPDAKAGETDDSNVYFPKCGAAYNSIVDGLNSIGVDSTFANRQRIASANGFSAYAGSAEENVSLLNKLKEGVLVDPDAKEEDEQVNYTCSDYSECTEGGADIYIITKDNCPIRMEAHNEGEVVCRGTVGQLISVNRVFETEKKTKWCEINVIDHEGNVSDEKLFIYTGNCELHDEHEFVNIFSTSKGSINFCSICGMAEAVAKNEKATCGLTCVADQAVKGSFSSYDPTFAAVFAQILVGEVPGIGTIADARDLVGDILNREPAWVLALDAAAFIPVVGAVKYADEISCVAKNGDDLWTGLKYTDEVLLAAKASNKSIQLGNYMISADNAIQFIYGASVRGRNVTGAHNLNYFISNLDRTGDNVSDLIKSKVAHPSIPGIYNITYQTSTSKGLAKSAKTVYDPSVISDKQMLDLMGDALSGDLTLIDTLADSSATLYAAKAHNGLVFEVKIDGDTVVDIYPVIRETLDRLS